jgi:hypothetical protein
MELKGKIENSWERIYLAVGSMICLRDVMRDMVQTVVQATRETALSKLKLILGADVTFISCRNALSASPPVRTSW